MQVREFVIFEEETHRFTPDDYTWAFNKKNNLEGVNVATGTHQFTWQPHGSQFTIIRSVPGAARRFSNRSNVPLVNVADVLDRIQFQADWIKIEE